MVVDAEEEWERVRLERAAEWEETVRARAEERERSRLERLAEFEETVRESWEREVRRLREGRRRARAEIDVLVLRSRNVRRI